MSQFELDQEYSITGIDLVDTMAEVAALHENAEERLQMFAAVGKVASGIIEFERILQPDKHLPEKSTVGKLAIDAQVAQPTLTVVDSKSSSEDLTTVDDSPEKEVEAVVPVSAPQPEVAAEKSQPEGLTLTEREQRAFEAITMTNAVPFKASDIKSHFGDISSSAQDQAFRTLIKKIRESPYASQLAVTGSRSTTRYTWQVSTPLELVSETPVEAAAEETVVISANEAATDSLPYAAEIENLSYFGMDLKIDGEKKFIDIRGVPLKLDTLAVDILMELGMHEGRMVLGDLLKSERIQSHNLDGHNQDTLRQSLVSIERLMAEHNILWRDAKVPVDGRTVRKLVLGDLGEIRLRKQAAQDIDFLDQGE